MQTHIRQDNTEWNSARFHPKPSRVIAIFEAEVCIHPATVMLEFTHAEYAKEKYTHKKYTNLINKI